MAHVPSIDPAPDQPAGPPARVSLRTPFSDTGFIDGAWWPRSRDLVGELPGLVAALAAAGHSTARLSYSLTAWNPAPRRMTVNGHKLRLGGFVTIDPQTVETMDAAGRNRVDLVVVAPEADAAVADRVMKLAGNAGTPARAREILASAAEGPNSTVMSDR